MELKQPWRRSQERQEFACEKQSFLFLRQEPMSRSMQLSYIPVTAFS